jgi:hydroxyacylglutathione hydrolase
MTLEIVTVACLDDNYAYIVKGPDGVCLIDAPEAEPIIDALEERGWHLGAILLTHHHGDHVQGVEELREKYSCKVMGPKAEETKMPRLDMALTEGMNGGNGSAYTVPMEVPGHTLGHMAYYFPNAGVVFTADSLMAFGCGRVFEGTMEMMWNSLQKFMALPPETLVYSGHEYTAANGRFAETIEPNNPDLIARVEAVAAKRAKGEPTVPSTIAEELATNPFLRGDSPEVQKSVNAVGKDAGTVFARVRQAKDTF